MPNKYYIRNGCDMPEILYCENDAEAFSVARLRNAKDKRANWKVYDEKGRVIFGVYQNNESGHFERVCK